MTSPLTVSVVGLGAIGCAVAQRLIGDIDGVQLVAVSGRHGGRSALPDSLPASVPVRELAEAVERAAVVVDCASGSFQQIAQAVLSRGRTLVSVNSAALLDHPELVPFAHDHGARILLPTGAILGLDAVRAAAEGGIFRSLLITRKPPRALANAPSVLVSGLNLHALEKPVCVFKGTARAGAARFPSNVNVAASLALAGIGPDRTELELWADPALTQTVHRIIVDAACSRFEMQIENHVAIERPGTSTITALSVVACIRRLAATLSVGS